MSASSAAEPALASAVAPCRNFGRSRADRAAARYARGAAAAVSPSRTTIGNDSSKSSGQPANMNLFGRRRSKPRGAPASKDPAQTIVSLRGTLDTLEKRQAHLDKQIAKQVAEAKAKMAKKDRRGALFCLKKKKMYEAEIEKLNGARLTLESQIIALEGTVTNADTVAAMKSGATAMKHARADVDADAVGDLMDDIQEEMATADEISAAISAPGGDLLGDDELLDELNELEEHELESQLLDAPPIPVAPLPDAPISMPAVPTQPPAAPAKQEDADLAALRELEAAMAM